MPLTWGMATAVADAAVWTTLLLLDSLLVWAIIRSGELQRNFLFLFFLTFIAFDLAQSLNVLVYDVPTYITRRIIFDPWVAASSVWLQCVRWFAGLFLLPLISFFHVLAVVRPLVFQRVTFVSVAVQIVCIIILAIVITYPLLTSCCGFKFYMESHSWYFDFDKPYTYLYVKANLYLQTVCISTMIIVNVFIVVKVSRLRLPNREFATTSVPSTVVVSSTFVGRSSDRTSTREPTNGWEKTKTRQKRQLTPEIRLAINYSVLTTCLVVSTLCFNFLTGGSKWEAIVLKVASALNMLKWVFYAAGNPRVRKTFLNGFTPVLTS